MSHTKSFDFDKNVGALIAALSRTCFPWYEGMEISPSSLYTHSETVYDIFSGIPAMISLDESRKMTKGEVDAPAYTEEYLNNAWERREVLEKIRAVNDTHNEAYYWSLLIEEGIVYRLMPGAGSYYKSKDSAQNLVILKERVEEKLKFIDQLRIYFNYEASVYRCAASIAEMATDDDTFIQISDDVAEGIAEPQQQGSGDNVAERYAWWITDTVASKGFPDPCLADIVMCVVQDVGLEALAEIISGEDPDTSAFSEPLQKMADAYATNAQTMQDIGQALARIPAEMERRFQKFQRENAPRDAGG